MTSIQSKSKHFCYIPCSDIIIHCYTQKKLCDVNFYFSLNLKIKIVIFIFICLIFKILLKFNLVDFKGKSLY